MNTNFFQTLMTVMMLLSSGATALLLKMGCKQLVDGTLDCATNTAPAWLAPYLIMAVPFLGVIKLVLAAFEGKLVKPTVPVSK